MQVKGSSLYSTREFIKAKFGEEGYKKWLAELPVPIAKAFSGSILASEWYSLKEFLIEPNQIMCDLFYKSDSRGAWEAGRYSADHGLRGMYRFFVKLGSVPFIAKKSSTILPTYYKPSKMQSEVIDENTVSVKITEFSDICDIIENRVGGWIEMAVEVSARKSTGVKIVKSLAAGDEYTEYLVSWE